MDTSNQPSYIKTQKTGQLAEKIKKAYDLLHDCTLCPRRCHVNRLAGQTGVCKTADKMKIGSFHPHFGEESPLVGRHGSGTIFISGCNLLCCFCQNFDISHKCQGQTVSDKQAAQMMLTLQEAGCHNINFVTPTHVVPQILSALEIAIQGGLHIPLVYNCGGYERVETLKLLDGIFDIYMPDFKFIDPDMAKRACGTPDYPEVAKRALREMHSQVNDLVVNNQGLAVRGLLVRHLVLPENLAGTDDVMAFIAEKISPETYVNIMGQYRPMGNAEKIPELCRPVLPEELHEAMASAKKRGISRLDHP
jgi:putative pyruvate formate lyase activating enzyme